MKLQGAAMVILSGLVVGSPLRAASPAATAPPAPAPAPAAKPAAPVWAAGTNYFLVQQPPPAPPSLPPGRIEVTEVFSYACPACNAFLPTMHKLIESLPANVTVDYLPASFNSSEDWPMF